MATAIALPNATLAPVSAMAAMSARAARRRGSIGHISALACYCVRRHALAKTPWQADLELGRGKPWQVQRLPRCFWICPPRVEFATRGSAVMAELSPASFEFAIPIAAVLI